MKLSREDLELRVLKHLITAPEAMIRAKALNITIDHFGYTEEGSKFSYTRNLVFVAYNYFEESDGSLLTQLVLENRLIGSDIKDGHKGKFLTLWADVEATEYDANELHDLLMQLKNRRAAELWRTMHKEGHAIMVESGIRDGVNYVIDCLKDIETELSSDTQERSTLDITQAADFFVKEYEKQRTKPPGILSGFDELDRRAYGWRGGEVVVVLGPSGGGKSLQLLNWAYNAHKQGKNVLYFSFELTLWQCLIRHISLCFKIPFNDLKRTSLEENVVSDLANSLRGMEDGAYFEYDFTVTDPTPEYVDMRIRELTAKRGKPDLVVADYIGEMTVRNAPSNTKSWELHEKAFDGLVKIARRHNIPVLTAQQVNRDTIRESRKSKDAGKAFVYDQSAASGGQHIIHQSHYVFIMEPDRETSMSVLHTVKSRDMWIPPYCVRVVPEFNFIENLGDEEQLDMRRVKNLGHSETNKTSSDEDRSATNSTTRDSDGNINVNINDQEYTFNAADDLTIDALEIDSSWGDG